MATTFSVCRAPVRYLHDPLEWFFTVWTHSRYRGGGVGVMLWSGSSTGLDATCTVPVLTGHLHVERSE